jgi:Restriction endonuclease
MPSRTNTFQKVIYLLQQHLAGSATVTESEFLIDRATGDRREVDVCIRANIAGSQIIICIECRDRQRKADVTWVEEMRGKHLTLPTDHLILASNSGFTPRAISKAEAYGIETVTPEGQSDAKIKELASRLNNARLTRIDFLKIEVVTARLGQTETEAQEDVRLLDSAATMNVYLGDDTYVCMIGEYVQSMIAGVDYGSIIFDALEDTKSFEIVDKTPGFLVPDGKKYLPIYFQKEKPALHLRLLERINIEGSARVSRAEFSVNHAKYRDIEYSWGEATLNGGKTVIVARGLESGQVSFRVSDLSK